MSPLLLQEAVPPSSPDTPALSTPRRRPTVDDVGLDHGATSAPSAPDERSPSLATGRSLSVAAGMGRLVPSESDAPAPRDPSGAMAPVSSTVQILQFWATRNGGNHTAASGAAASSAERSPRVAPPTSNSAHSFSAFIPAGTEATISPVAPAEISGRNTEDDIVPRTVVPRPSGQRIGSALFNQPQPASQAQSTTAITSNHPRSQNNVRRIADSDSDEDYGYPDDTNDNGVYRALRDVAIRGSSGGGIGLPSRTRRRLNPRLISMALQASATGANFQSGGWSGSANGGISGASGGDAVVWSQVRRVGGNSRTGGGGATGGAGRSSQSEIRSSSSESRLFLRLDANGDEIPFPGGDNHRPGPSVSGSRSSGRHLRRRESHGRLTGARALHVFGDSVDSDNSDGAHDPVPSTAAQFRGSRGTTARNDEPSDTTNGSSSRNLNSNTNGATNNHDENNNSSDDPRSRLARARRALTNTNTSSVEEPTNNVNSRTYDVQDLYEALLRATAAVSNSSTGALGIRSRRNAIYIPQRRAGGGTNSSHSVTSANTGADTRSVRLRDVFGTADTRTRRTGGSPPEESVSNRADPFADWDWTRAEWDWAIVRPQASSNLTAAQPATSGSGNMTSLQVPHLRAAFFGVAQSSSNSDGWGESAGATSWGAPPVVTRQNWSQGANGYGTASMGRRDGQRGSDSDPDGGSSPDEGHVLLDSSSSTIAAVASVTDNGSQRTAVLQRRQRTHPHPTDITHHHPSQSKSSGNAANGWPSGWWSGYGPSRGLARMLDSNGDAKDAACDVDAVMRVLCFFESGGKIACDDGYLNESANGGRVESIAASSGSGGNQANNLSPTEVNGNLRWYGRTRSRPLVGR